MYDSVNHKKSNVNKKVYGLNGSFMVSICIFNNFKHKLADNQHRNSFQP